ncbi:hypothetical protein ASG25_07040 [Rhizobium sp. Leaf384]|uniref:hypothetical protein n=1 Tax=unclassified Rhizobium TaxID=2613769 RepID=UPI000713FDDF|nr:MULTISPECIES: hypothetical protein [unclassified Rhizobium]KQR78020.1 hypothetical protein ASG03_16920 [Rhizobium sp. Leaf341]KQS81233.1 hypothetical protein ASG25_07040 [Rhizobium sp. Leaf384]KQS87142.1 hypothetical protein ASG58_02605 [Rhizobium sp. Leaf383]
MGHGICTHALLAGVGIMLFLGIASVTHAAEPRQPGLTFDNLPGVKPEDPIGMTSNLRCEQVLIDRALGNILPTRGPRYDTVNVCSRNGGPEFVSPRLPPSTYRQLRGLNY